MTVIITLLLTIPFVSLLTIDSPLETGGSVGAAKAQETYPRNETLYAFIDGGRRTVPDNFNPYTTGWISSAGHNQIAQEYLFYYNYENGTLMPWLAKGYSLSDDYKTLTIYLREGITWSDGVEFNASDVEFTYNMLLTPHTPPLSYEERVQDEIESVEAVDATTVVFHFKKPNPRAPYTDLFSVMIWGSVYLVPKHIWKDVDPTTYKNNPPVVTGPYNLSSYSENGDLYVWKRRDDWWGTKLFGIQPAPKYIVYVAYATEEATALELAANKLDVGGYITPGTFKALRETNPNITAWYPHEPYAWAEVCPLFFPINCAKYPWNNPKVRWAISYAINRTELNVVAQEGTAPPFGNLFSPYMEPRFLNAVAEKEKEYNPLEYNPAKTEQIFTELGWKKGDDGIWVTDNGTRVEFEVLTHSGWLFIRKYGEDLADQLRRVGIDATAKLLTGTAWSNAYSTGDYDGNAMWFCASVNEPYPTLVWFHSKWARPIGTVCPSNNVRWSNATYDEIIDQMASMSPKDPQYIELFKRAMDILYQEMPAIPTTHQPALIAYSNTYWTNWPSSENPYIQPYFQCATWLFVVLNVKSTYVPPVKPPTPPPQPTVVEVIPSWVYALAAITVISIVVAIWALATRRR